MAASRRKAASALSRCPIFSMMSMRSGVFSTLKKMPALQHLHLVQAGLNEKEKQEFQAALPDCVIKYVAATTDDDLDDDD